MRATIRGEGENEQQLEMGGEDESEFTGQKCRKICGLGCVTHAHARAQVMQPSPHVFLHICSFILTLTSPNRHCSISEYTPGGATCNGAKFVQAPITRIQGKVGLGVPKYTH